MEQKCKAAMSDIACLPPDRLTQQQHGEHRAPGHRGHR